MKNFKFASLVPFLALAIGATVDTGGNFAFDSTEINWFANVFKGIAWSILGLFADIWPYALIFVGIFAGIALIFGVVNHIRHR